MEGRDSRFSVLQERGWGHCSWNIVVGTGCAVVSCRVGFHRLSHHEYWNSIEPPGDVRVRSGELGDDAVDRQVGCVTPGTRLGVSSTSSRQETILLDLGSSEPRSR